MTACCSYRQKAEVSYQQVRKKVKVLGSAVPTGRSHCGRPPDRQQEAAVAASVGVGVGGTRGTLEGWLQVGCVVSRKEGNPDDL